MFAYIGLLKDEVVDFIEDSLTAFAADNSLRTHFWVHDLPIWQLREDTGRTSIIQVAAVTDGDDVLLFTPQPFKDKTSYVDGVRTTVRSLPTPDQISSRARRLKLKLVERYLADASKLKAQREDASSMLDGELQFCLQQARTMPLDDVRVIRIPSPFETATEPARRQYDR
jgi:hypothetical protein